MTCVCHQCVVGGNVFLAQFPLEQMASVAVSLAPTFMYMDIRLDVYPLCGNIFVLVYSHLDICFVS